MLTLISLEVFKMRKKPRSYLGFAGLFAVSVLMAIGLKYGPSPERQVMGAVPREMLVVGSVLTGGFVAVLMLQGVFFAFAPLFVSMVAGDTMAGEANDGTLRTAMSRPVSRAAFFGAKLVSSSLYAAAVTLFTGVSAYIVGTIALGRGPVPVAWEGFAIYPEGQGLVRLLGAYALACVPMIAVASIALLISTIVNSSPAAIVGPMILIIGLAVIGEIQFFAPAKPYFFTTYLDLPKYALAPHVSWADMAKGIGYLFAYIVAFTGAAGLVFCRKDILT